MKRQRMEEELAGCNTVAAVITRTQLARQRTNSAMEHTTQTRTDMHDAYTFDNLSGSDFSRKIQALPFHCNVHKKIQPERQLHAASLCGESALIGRKKTALSSY